ncbi:MAG: ABC transporter ATP-binding protein [Bacteroidetes bacterium]|nr:ABC transporter ATP-binding protein [Bacteroidota bacterium]
MLKAQNITKKYEQLAVLKGVSIEVKKAEIVSIVGSSGAGKSTLLHILGTLDQADSGTISINNQAIDQLKGRALAQFRNKHIGFVFQFHHLLPEFSAIENVSIPGWIAGRNKKEVEADAVTLLTKLGINKPVIIFADEPTGNLDSKNARELHELFVSLRNEFQQTFLIVTHNEELAGMSNRRLYMKDGLMVP